MHESTPRSKDGGDASALRWAIPLSTTYLFVLASVFFWTYIPRYFVAIGWTSTAIGVALSVMTVARSLAHPTWAWVSDRHRLGSRLLRYLFLAGVGVLAFLPFVESRFAVYATLIGFAITAGAALPLVDTLTVREISPASFGRIRAWGSAGFGLAALGFSVLGLTLSHGELAGWVPWLVFAMYAGALFSAVLMPSSKASPASPTLSAAWRLLNRPLLLAMVPLWALHWASQSPYGLFFVFLCEQKGLGGWTPGAGVAVGIIGEVFILALGARLTRRVSPETLFAICATVTALRWGLSSFVDHPWLLVAIQVGHGLTFGGFLLAVMAILDRELADEVRATGQALLYVFVFGVGSALGNGLSGWILDHHSAETLYLWAGGVEIAILLPAIFIAVLRSRSRPS